MKFFAMKQANLPAQALYTTPSQFCRIFQNDMDRLYTLSLMLTGNHELAEKCFVGGLETSNASNSVFKEWAHSWARRSIIINAVRMIEPRPTGILPSTGQSQYERAQPSIAAILALPVFDRFAYVLSVLEGYPLQECALLLDCRRDEVITARMRALQQVVQWSGDATKNTETGNRALADSGQFDRLWQLAATA